MTRLRTRLAEQRGISLPVVCLTLLVIALLSTAIASQAIVSRQDSTHDRNSVRALAAAQAGLTTANYRLNMLKPADTQCVTDVLSAPNSGGDCTITETVGNGGSYTYYVTQKIATGSGCDSLPGAPAPGTHRCITSTGTVNGVVRRIQARVAASPPYMPVHGFFGLDLVWAKNNMDFAGADLGSNRLVDLNNNDSFGLLQLGPGASCNCTGASYTGTVNNPSAFTLPTPPIAGTEKPCPGLVEQGCNNDAVLTAADGYVDNAVANIRRSLIMTHDLTLPAGDYNFCRLDFGAGYNLSPAPGAVARIFVDAPNSIRNGSGCPENTNPAPTPKWGELRGDNASSINAPNGNPANMQIFVYGWPPTGSYATTWGQNTITFSKNNGEIDALVFAPNSVVNVAKNNGIVKGAIAGWQVYVKNNVSYNWDANLANLGSTTNVKGWFECHPRPTNPTVPESGC